MTIAGSAQEGKGLIEKIPKDFLAILILLLVATAAYGLGILTGRDLERRGGGGLWVEELPVTGTTTSAAAAQAFPKAEKAAPEPVASLPAASTAQAGAYVGSVNGKSYYLPDCGGAKRIKPENLVWFVSKADAESRGYAPSRTCKGL